MESPENRRKIGSALKNAPGLRRGAGFSSVITTEPDAKHTPATRRAFKPFTDRSDGVDATAQPALFYHAVPRLSREPPAPLSMPAGVGFAGPLKCKEMTRNPAARRVRQTETSFDDAFVARAYEASTWASRNRQKVIISTIAFVVVVLGLVWYARYRSTMADKAMTELTRVRATVQSGNNALATADLEKYIASFGNTKSANEARLMLAQQYLMAGQSDKAVKTLESMRGRESTPEGAQASFALAEAYEGAKSTDKAETLYTALGDNAPYLYMKQDGLDNAARLHVERGDLAGAATLLQKLVDLTPETAPERDVFKLRLGEALAAAGKPIPADPAK